MLSVRPLRGPIDITSDFGPRVIAGVDDFHDGTDFKAAVGTPLFAMGNGVVSAAGAGVGGNGGGNAIAIVDDDDGQLFFLHLSRIAVNEGQRVSAGQLIGETGDTGRVTGPHLHLQWRPHWPDRTTADIGPVVVALPAPGGGGGGGGAAVVFGAVALGGYAWWRSRRRRR